MISKLQQVKYNIGSNLDFCVEQFDYLPPHARDFSRELGGYSIFQL